MRGRAYSVRDILCCLSPILWHFITFAIGGCGSDAGPSSDGYLCWSLASWVSARSTLLDYQPGRRGRVRRCLQSERLQREAQTGCHQADQPERPEYTKDDRSYRYL